MLTTNPPGDPAAAAIDRLLAALGPIPRVDALYALPMPAIVLPDIGVLIATTPAPAPIFRGVIERYATAERLDALLLRVGEVADGRLPVHVDATLALLPCAPWSMRSLRPWLSDDDALWLVSEAGEPAVSVTPAGIAIELALPFDHPAERAAGIERAARAMARSADLVEAW